MASLDFCNRSRPKEVSLDAAMDLKSVTNLVMKTIPLALPPVADPRLSRGSELGGSCRARVARGNGGFRGERYLENARPGNGATEAGARPSRDGSSCASSGRGEDSRYLRTRCYWQRVRRRSAKCDGQDDGKSSGRVA
jgi:hypothetical protein